MSYEVTEEQHELAEMLDDLLGSVSRPRQSFDGGPSHDAELWKNLRELGLVGLVLPERLGGAGGSMMDLVIVAERLGAATAAVPVVSSAVAAVALSGLGGPIDVAQRLVSGEEIVLAAVSASTGLEFEVRAEPVGENWQLTGAALDLLEASPATELLVVAATDDGPFWFGLRLDASGVSWSEQPSLDPTQRLARLSLDGAPAIRLGAVDREGAEMRAAWVLLGAQALGAASRALEISVEYALEREAFGQPIGRFQAIKHRMADMLVMVENARSAVYNGAWALDARRPDAATAAHLAKAVGTENAVKVIQDAIQSHGGIGFTWEHDLHLFLRRAKTCELVLDSPGGHFEAIARAVIDPRLALLANDGEATAR